MVGIEHTQIFRLPDSKVTLQAQEKHQDRIVAQAQQIFEKRSKTLYSLTVGFNPDLVLRPSDEHKVAGRLADLVDDIERDFDIAVGQGGCIHGWLYQQNGLGKFPSGISELYVERVDRQGYALWDAGHGGIVSELTAELIQESKHPTRDARMGTPPRRQRYRTALVSEPRAVATGSRCDFGERTGRTAFVRTPAMHY